ncbi:MAG: major tail protein [Clostridia bacterium]
MTIERPASSIVGLKRLAFAVCTNVGCANVKPTYGPIHICDGLVKANPEAEEEPEARFLGNKRWRYMPSDITIEKTGLTPEFQKLMLGQTLVNGVLEKRQSDEPPIIALLWETEQANKKRVRWLLPMVKIQSAEPDKLATRSDSVEFQHFMLSGIYWHTLNGVKYRKAYEELNSRQFADWFKTVQI